MSLYDDYAQLFETLCIVSISYRHTEYSVDIRMIYVSGDRVEYFFSHLPILGIIVQVGMGESNGKNKGMRPSPFRNSHV